LLPAALHPGPGGLVGGAGPARDGAADRPPQGRGLGVGGGGALRPAREADAAPLRRPVPALRPPWRRAEPVQQGPDPGSPRATAADVGPRPPGAWTAARQALYSGAQDHPRPPA